MRSVELPEDLIASLEDEASRRRMTLTSLLVARLSSIRDALGAETVETPERFAQWDSADHALWGGMLWFPLDEAASRITSVPVECVPDLDEHGDYLNSWTFSVEGEQRYRLTLAELH